MIKEQLYKKLSQVIPDMETRLVQGTRYGTSKVNGFMDLNFDYLGSRKDGKHIIALSHTYELNGDLVPDPDMQMRIDTATKTAEAMTFQNIYTFQEVAFDEAETTPQNEQLKKQLNLFLSEWLNNAIAQGHRIDFAQAEQELEALRRKNDQNPEQGIER